MSSIQDAGIPILTEVIPGPHPVESKPPVPTIPVPSPIAAATENIALIEAHASAMWEEEQWLRLEHEIRERVLIQVLERIDFVLEQRVRDSLADVLQTAVEGLATEIRNGLHNSIKDVITRAVTHEISKLQAIKK